MLSTEEQKRSGQDVSGKSQESMDCLHIIEVRLRDSVNKAITDVRQALNKKRIPGILYVGKDQESKL